MQLKELNLGTLGICQICCDFCSKKARAPGYLQKGIHGPADGSREATSENSPRFRRNRPVAESEIGGGCCETLR